MPWAKRALHRLSRLTTVARRSTQLPRGWLRAPNSTQPRHICRVGHRGTCRAQYCPARLLCAPRGTASCCRFVYRAVYPRNVRKIARQSTPFLSTFTTHPLTRSPHSLSKNGPTLHPGHLGRCHRWRSLIRCPMPRQQVREERYSIL